MSQRKSCLLNTFLLFSTCFLMIHVIFDNTDMLTSSRQLTKPKPRTKTILLWNSFFRWKDYKFGLGSEPFLTHKCEETECYVTNKRDWLSAEQYDAVVFHGAEYYPKKKTDFPERRQPFQIYAYLSMESPMMRPMYSNLNGMFNITITYRLDSDIPLPYFHMENLRNETVSPSQDPQWIQPNSEQLSPFLEIHKRKSKTVAWFVSNCHSPNKRNEMVKELQKYVKVDVYGTCGTLDCSRKNESVCFEMLKNEYYFYLSYENSNCVDYVTEKTLNAFNYDVNPVYFGNANLTKFIPPYSYINASEYTAQELAKKFTFLINNPLEYAKYFWWRNYYKVGYSVPHFCNLCKYLHSDKIETPHWYPKLQDWYYGTKDQPMCHR